MGRIEILVEVEEHSEQAAAGVIEFRVTIHTESMMIHTTAVAGVVVSGIVIVTTISTTILIRITHPNHPYIITKGNVFVNLIKIGIVRNHFVMIRYWRTIMIHCGPNRGDRSLSLDDLSEQSNGIL